MSDFRFFIIESSDVLVEALDSSSSTRIAGSIYLFLEQNVYRRYV